MKSKSLLTGFLALTFAILACKEEEVPILTGDVKGKVSLFDGYGYALEDQSGVQVQLSGNDIIMEGATDAAGRYSFEDLPIGNYRINLIKENYIESILDFHLSHVGGDAPTLTNQTLNEVPEYRYAIDSITYGGYHELSLYLKATEANRPIQGTVYIHSFFSHSSNVTYENYDNNLVSRAYHESGSDIFVQHWQLPWGANDFINDYTDTVYCRVYPQTYFDEMWPEYPSGPSKVIPETLGNPSEVYAMPLD